MNKKILSFISVLLTTALFCSSVAFAANVNVFYVTPKGVTTRTAPAGTNMTWMGPTDINVDGYAFCGWDVSLANVQQDTVARAVYLPKGGTSETSAICQTWQSLPSGVLSYSNVTSATLPKETEKLTNPPTPMTVPGTLAALDVIRLNPVGVPGKTCVVKWFNGSTGELWKADVVKYGASLPQPEDPCITGLEFTGWHGSWTNITEDRNIVGSFYKNYKVVYVCEYCGEVMGERMIREGDSVPYFNSIPHDHSNSKHHYGFIGWYDPLLQSDGYTIVVLADCADVDHRKDYGIPDDVEGIKEEDYEKQKAYREKHHLSR